MIKQNPILYWQIVGPGFHEELLGFSRSCNMFELMHLIGSEKCGDNFEKVKLDDRYLSHLSLKTLGISKPMKVAKAMAAKYPWFKLAESLGKEGFRCPLIAEKCDHGFKVIEGKHRFGASSLIEPFDVNRKLPCLVIVRDELYTKKMFKRPHPHPLAAGGFKTYATK